MPLTKIAFAPGIDKQDTEYGAAGRWTDSDMVRFRYGLPEKIGGWIELISEKLIGVIRDMHAWTDLDGIRDFCLSRGLGDVYKRQDGINITTFNTGPVGTFNSNGSGNAGTNPGNCGGDNCQIAGGTGGSSYAGPGAVTGGTGAPAGGSGSAGTRGSGGGGGGAQPQSAGTAGGAGEVSYRFMRIA